MADFDEAAMAKRARNCVFMDSEVVGYLLNHVVNAEQEGIGKLVTDQLRNLRSVVAAAACRCATALATGLGSDGRGLADEHWTATLLGVASGGAPKVVQEAATQALPPSPAGAAAQLFVLTSQVARQKGEGRGSREGKKSSKTQRKDIVKKRPKILVVSMSKSVGS